LSINDKELIKKAANVASAAPQEWDGLVKELERYALDLNSKCVTADIATVPVEQGRARHHAELINLFKTAVNTVDRMTRR
jgi:hypothetical protein